MPTFKITAPSRTPAIADQVGAVQLINGQATCNDIDHAAEIAYFRQAGYLVEELEDQPSSTVDERHSA